MGFGKTPQEIEEEKAEKKTEEEKKTPKAEEKPKEDEKEEPEKEKTRFQVVKELPVQAVRTIKDEEGMETTLLTIEEALTHLMGGDL
ncbi:MAG TPA: hypothetical protein ENH99_03240 [Candidatus Pacearchaeota archaeon]|nr:hypothetical protein [Candidatus Pacearchaeota archaeon]